MDKEYKKINPETYMINGMFDSSSLVGVPIKLGRDKEIMELFDDITKQLINESLVQISDVDDKTFVSYMDDSEGFPVSKVVEDKGDGVMVMFNENGSLSPYDEKVAELYKDVSDYDADPDYDDDEYDEDLS